MNRLLSALQNPQLYPHPVSGFELLETHISWVLLTGLYAYKIKKPVNFGFLDFSTLEKRRYYCHEELRLNQRLARDYYLEVISFTGSPEQPVLNGSGPVFEYAVKMKQFPQDAQFDRLLAQGLLTSHHIQALANTVADFHQQIATAGRDTIFGSPETIKAAVDENFAHIFPSVIDSKLQQLVKSIQHWCETEFRYKIPQFQQRKQDGFIRECHGDMHLRNMALTDDSVLIFDCIEFNEEFRWIDVMSEIAFAVMDLDDRQQTGFANEFLNTYLEISGDYAGLALLPYYLVYRALVRAKVDCLRLSQSELAQNEKQNLTNEFRHYLDLAWQYTQPHTNYLMITHGLSGSGKSWFTEHVMTMDRFIRLRSDVVRKQLFNLPALQESRSTPDAGIYNRQASDMTYRRLADLSRLLLSNHWSVIVDATFLDQNRRDSFRKLALELEKPFLILDFQASPGILRERIHTRMMQKDASEATLEILDRQITQQQPLSDEDRKYTFTIQAEDTLNPATIWSEIRRHFPDHLR